MSSRGTGHAIKVIQAPHASCDGLSLLGVSFDAVWRERASAGQCDLAVLMARFDLTRRLKHEGSRCRYSADVATQMFIWANVFHQ